MLAGGLGVLLGDGPEGLPDVPLEPPFPGWVVVEPPPETAVGTGVRDGGACPGRVGPATGEAIISLPDGSDVDSSSRPSSAS